MSHDEVRGKLFRLLVVRGATDAAMLLGVDLMEGAKIIRQVADDLELSWREAAEARAHGATLEEALERVRKLLFSRAEEGGY